MFQQHFSISLFAHGTIHRPIIAIFSRCSTSRVLPHALSFSLNVAVDFSTSPKSNSNGIVLTVSPSVIKFSSKLHYYSSILWNYLVVVGIVINIIIIKLNRLHSFMCRILLTPREWKEQQKKVSLIHSFSFSLTWMRLTLGTVGKYARVVLRWTSNYYRHNRS